VRTPGGVAMSERQIQCRDGQLVAVTTRSRLHSARLFPAMLLATWAIRRQLARTEGLVRWASLVAGPTEFWTITVWRTRHAMQEFMRSDAHGRIMWRYTRWLDGLWLMRWRPGAVEVGSWAGVTLTPPARSARARRRPPSLTGCGARHNTFQTFTRSSSPVGAPAIPAPGTPAGLLRRPRGRKRR
jgi:hypothetical protein